MSFCQVSRFSDCCDRCRYAKSRCAECHYAECHGAICRVITRPLPNVLGPFLDQDYVGGALSWGGLNVSS
jgi:hypothetical protein